MKVIFEFDTDKEDFDESEFERVKHADDLASALYDITNQLRSWYQYDTRKDIPIEEVHEKIWDIIQNNYINIDRLYS